MNNVLNDNIIIFFIFVIVVIYKPTKLECQEIFLFLFFILRARREMVMLMIRNVNGEIVLQNDKHDDNINLDRID